MDQSQVLANWNRTLSRVRSAEKKYGRARDSVSVLPISKTQPPEMIALVADAGQNAFGESYLQEAQAKIKSLSKYNIEWHFIGSIQSNKTKQIAELFSWVHSVDRFSVAERLSRQRPTDLPDLNICLQINLSGEKNKSGIETDISTMAEAVSSLPGLRFRGLMTIPRPSGNIIQQREIFSRFRKQFMEIKDLYSLDTLSMGMSADFEAAIAEGSTVVRLGTFIFGPRLNKRK